MTDPQNPTPPAYEPPASQPSAYQPPAYEQPAYPQSSAPAYAAPAYPASGYDAPGAPVPGRTMGIVAFILSFFAQPVALILGIIALVQSKKAGQKNGFAVAAIIISSILMVVGIIVAIAFIAWFGSAAADLGTQLQACLDNGGVGTVEVNGITMSCEELLSESGN